MTSLDYVQDKRTGQLRGSRRKRTEPVTRPNPPHSTAASALPGKPGTPSNPVNPEEYYTALQTRLAMCVPHTPTFDQPHDIADLIADITERITSGSIRVLNHANNRTNEDTDGTIDMALLTSREHARNNCHAATLTITELIEQETDLPADWEVHQIGLQYAHPTNPDSPNGHAEHWAVQLTNTNTNETWVLDYTAAQFTTDTTVPFPVVARRNTWQTWISSTVRNMYGHDLTGIQTHNAI